MKCVKLEQTVFGSISFYLRLEEDKNIAHLPPYDKYKPCTVAVVRYVFARMHGMGWAVILHCNNRTMWAVPRSPYMCVVVK